MSVSSRKPAIRKLVSSVVKLTRNNFDVISNSGHKYHMWLSTGEIINNGQVEYTQINCTCNDKTLHNHFDPCPGNVQYTVCKHSIAAAIHRLERAGYRVSICDTIWQESILRKSRLTGYQVARKLMQFPGSTLVKLVSTQSVKHPHTNEPVGIAWLVARKSIVAVECEYCHDIGKIKAEQGKEFDCPFCNSLSIDEHRVRLATNSELMHGPEEID